MRRLPYLMHCLEPDKQWWNVRHSGSHTPRYRNQASLDQKLCSPRRPSESQHAPCCFSTAVFFPFWHTVWNVNTFVSTSHHLQSTGQSFRDIEGDVFVSTRSLALDSKGQKAVGIPAQDHSSPGAASALAGDRPTEFFLKVNGRSCRRSVGDVPPPPRLKPWSTAVLQESGSNYWQPCQSLPTLLAVQNNSEPSKWSAQKAVRLDGAISWRGRRRSSSRESTGVMQKLNLSPIKIGNTLGTNFAGNYCCGGISKQQKPGRLSLGSTVAVWGTKSRKGLEQRVPATRRIRITSSDSSRNGSFLRLGSRGLAARRQ